MLKSWLTRQYGHRPVTGATLLTPDTFQDLGVEGVVLDLDNTLVQHHGNDLTMEVAAWMASLKKSGLKVLILSNTQRSERLARMAKAGGALYLQCGIVPIKFGNVKGFGAKPSRQAFLRAAAALDLPPGKLAMVGDQLFTDILGANRAGYKVAFLVTPMDVQENLLTMAKRPAEKALLRLMSRWEKP